MDKIHALMLPLELLAAQNDAIYGLEIAKGKGARQLLRTGVADGFGDGSGILQSTVSGNDSSTKLLLNFENSLTNSAVGGSSVVAAYGDAKVRDVQTKFGTGALALDGNADFLTCDGSADFTFGTGDFTVDLWFRLTNAPTSCYLIDWRPNNIEGLYPTLYIDSLGQVNYYTDSINRIAATFRLLLGAWYHVALVRSANVTKLYVNGTQTGVSFTDTSNYINGGALRPIIGAYGLGLYGFNGWMDEIRISKGVARWTTNFTPPASQYGTATVSASVNHAYDPALDLFTPAPTYAFGSIDPQTKILLKGDGINTDFRFVDSSLVPNAVTMVPGPYLSNAQSKFGGSSMYFSGTGYVTIADDPALELQNYDFCIDFWIRPDNITGTKQFLIKNTYAGYSTLYAQQVGAQLHFYSSTNATSWDVFSGFGGANYPVAAGVWSHCALTRNGNVFSLYKDGVLAQTVTAGSSVVLIDQTGPWNIGGVSGGTQWAGYIDEFRLSIGTPRWTAAFTPPTTEYIKSPVGNMRLLSVADSGPTVPAAAKVTVQIDTALAYTPNTDVIAKVSRDGATWATANLQLISSIGTLKTYEDSRIDLSAQGAGTTLQLDVSTFNNKSVPIKGTVKQWAA